MTEFARLVKRAALPLRYPQEFLATSGVRLRERDGASVVCFTTPRCASTFTKEALSLIANRYLGLTPLDFPGYLWHASARPVYEELGGLSSRVFRSQGYCYITLREFIEIDHLEQYKVLLMIRDPRDVMVSEYYSRAISHTLPANSRRRKEFLELRQTAKQMTVDEFVLSRAVLELCVFGLSRETGNPRYCEPSQVRNYGHRFRPLVRPTRGGTTDSTFQKGSGNSCCPGWR